MSTTTWDGHTWGASFMRPHRDKPITPPPEFREVLRWSNEWPHSDPGERETVVGAWSVRVA